MTMKLSTAAFAIFTGLLMTACTDTSKENFTDGVTESLNDEGRVNIGLMEWTRVQKKSDSESMPVLRKSLHLPLYSLI